MRISALLLDDPASGDGGTAALQALGAAHARGDEIFRLFFYSHAVHVARAGAHPALVERWTSLACSAGAELIACSSSALRRGVLDEHEADAEGVPPTLVPGFRLAGLGQLAEAIVSSDRLLVCGSRQPPHAGVVPALSFQETNGTPLVILGQGGSDATGTRESLDLAMALAAFLPGTALLFRDAGVALLRSGAAANPHEKAMKALVTYGLDHRFAAGGDLPAHGLAAGDFCIPCQIADDAGCEALIGEHAPVIAL